ncbi:MAG: AMP phosphorylase [Methanomassiliicoccales archaeon PtaU1.Bin124]|nr:MAG: AMP phosphorylase [Methanomassiliicoccales archaeon PtaU1.Bin124]
MKLNAKFIDVDTGEITALMHDSDAAGLGVREKDRVRIVHEGSGVVAIVTTSDTFVKRGEIGLLGQAFKFVGPEEGETIDVFAASRPESVECIKRKMDGLELSKDEIYTLVRDIASRSLSNIELAAYVTSLQINGMNIRETADLTMAMVETGETIKFDKGPVYDFHSIGGCPGNKITLLVVPIMAAAGCLIPKTSSRAISSAAGTSDIVEVFANVDLDSRTLKQITESVGGVMAWGGSLNLAPADDVIIKAEYPLGIDPHPQLLASVMSKKKAVGADYLLIDIPMGDGTKVPTMEGAKQYAKDFIELGEKLGIKVECAITYGGQPVGRAIGPALEAREAISILEGAKTPNSVIEKTITLSGMLFDMGNGRGGEEKAREMLESGKALAKFREIVAAQGGEADIKADDIKVGAHTYEILAKRSGYINKIKNKDFVKIARAAGSPNDKGAGLVFNKKVGNKVDSGEVLFTIYADNEAKLADAKALAQKLEPMLIEGMVLAKVPSFGRVTF